MTAASVAALGAVSLAGFRYAIQGRRSAVFAPSVWQGSGESRRIALTFDDGPSPGTAALLAYLREQGVRCTFFQCGANVLRHPELARAVATSGHEIGNHTFSHRRLAPRVGWQMNLLSQAEVYAEFGAAQDAIRETTGVTPRLLRAPYGMRWLGLRETQRRQGLLGVMWSAIGHDWEWPAERVAQHLLRGARPGAIFCLHDGRDTHRNPDIRETLKAVGLLVPELRRRGFALVTVSELLGLDAESTKVAGRG